MSDARYLLVVDDSKLTRMMVQAFVTQNCSGWTVLEAANADEALQQAQEMPVDKVTLDINMPGMDGLSLLPRLRERLPEAEIALLTANIQQSVRSKAQQHGVKLIPKPVTEDKIVAFVTGE